MSLPSVLVRISTGEILNRIPYPRADMGLIEGIDPDLKLLLVHEPYPVPNYDSRMFVLNTTETISETPHPNYPHLHCYMVTHTTTKRPIAEIEVHVKAAQRLADEAIFKSQEQMSSSIRMLSIMDKQNQGLPINSEEQAILEALRQMRVKIDKNLDNYTSLMALIEAGIEPNIDGGWESA